MYISVELAKKHLNINPSFTADDDYIALIIEAAEKAVLKTCNLNDIDELEGNGTIPSPVIFATLLLIGDMYSNRQTNAFTTVNKIPTFKFLLANFIKYNDENLEG